MKKNKYMDIKKLLVSMSIEDKAGQLAIPMFQSSSVTRDIEKAITKKLVGFIRYSPNANYDNMSEPIGGPNPNLTPSQTAELMNELQLLARETSAKIPLSINIDQEGGIETDVNRGGITIFPSQMGLSAANDTKLAESAGKVIATEMRAMGLTLNQTPSLDVIKADGYRAVKTLTFGDNTSFVSKQASAFVRGLKQGNIAVMLKHFPSYGSTSKDAHEGLPEILKTKSELMKEDIIIYQKAIQAGADAVMIGHILARCLDNSDTPASLSEKIVTGFLRNELKFDGVVQTDALRMKAILDRYGVAKASIMAVQAGCDSVLLRGNMDFFEEGYYAILGAAKQGKISESRLNESVMRILTLKARLGLFKNPLVNPEKTLRTVGSKEHRKISMEVARKSVTLLRNRKNILPVKISEAGRIMVFTVEAKKLVPTSDPVQSPDMLIRAVKYFHPDARGHLVPLNPSVNEIAKAKKLAGNADIIIIGTTNAVINKQQVLLVKELESLKKLFVVVAMQSPHDIVEFSEIDTYLCTYELSNDSMIAASGIIFGKIKPQGKLPVKLALNLH